MVALPSLLGKWGPASHPTGSPTGSGKLPAADYIPAAPASKTMANHDMEERFECLLESYTEPRVEVLGLSDLLPQVAKLTQHVSEEQDARKAVE